MKTLILLLLLSTTAFSQTGTISSITMQSQDWAWLVGKYGTAQDSISTVYLRTLRSQVQANLPANWNTNFTATNIPERMVIRFYTILKNASAGEIAQRYVAINSALRVASLDAYFDTIDEAWSLEFIRTRDRGKWTLVD